MSDSREQALKNQLAKAQALIRQFEDGTRRHNSNLAAHGMDGEARINLDPSQFDEAHRRFLRAIGLIEPDWIVEQGVKPRDDVERDQISRCLLRARPQDCHIGQLVRLEAIEMEGRERENWATVIVPTGEELYFRDENVVEQVVTRFEFERVRYVRDAQPAKDREFWKRIA